MSYFNSYRQIIPIITVVLFAIASSCELEPSTVKVHSSWKGNELDVKVSGRRNRLTRPSYIILAAGKPSPTFALDSPIESDRLINQVESNGLKVLGTAQPQSWHSDSQNYRIFIEANLMSVFNDEKVFILLFDKSIAEAKGKQYLGYAGLFPVTLPSTQP